MGNSAISASGQGVQLGELREVNPGGMIKHYPIRHQMLKRGFWTLVGFLLLLAALVTFLFGTFNSWSAVQVHGRAVLLRTVPLPLLGFLVASTLGIVILSTTARHWRDTITLYVNGLDLHQGKVQRFLPWQSICQFDARIKVIKFATSNLDVRSIMQLVDETGLAYKVTDRFADLSDLIGQVRNRLLPILYQNTTQHLQAGSAVFFHDQLDARSEGLIIDGEAHPWGTIQGRIHRGRLHIQQLPGEQTLFKQKTKRIRNLDLLMTLLDNPPALDQALSPK